MKRPSHNLPYHSRTTSATGNSSVIVASAGGIEIANEVLAWLEELDDTIFAALDGDPKALNDARGLLSRAEQELQGDIQEPLVAEARRQYVRRAETLWQASQSNPQESLPPSVRGSGGSWVGGRGSLAWRVECFVLGIASNDRPIKQSRNFTLGIGTCRIWANLIIEDFLSTYRYASSQSDT